MRRNVPGEGCPGRGAEQSPLCPQLKRQNAPCRPPADAQCDLPELCDGSSASCPPDLYVQDGHDCERGTGYCYKGRCRSPDLQCQRLYGRGNWRCWWHQRKPGAAGLAWGRRRDPRGARSPSLLNLQVQKMLLRPVMKRSTVSRTGSGTVATTRRAATSPAPGRRFHGNAKC